MDIISPLQKAILSNRSIPTSKYEQFVFPYYDITDKLYMLKDMVEARTILARHMMDGSDILNVTDLDTDGICSGVVFSITLKEIYKYPKEKIHTIVSKRRDGRGFSNKLTEKVIHYVNKHKVKLIITSDHGSGDELQYVKIKKLCPNVQIIVTDHHQVDPNNFPITADAFINPHRPDDTYPNKEICGCVVLWLLLSYTYPYLKENNIISNKVSDVYEAFRIVLPYLAISTIVDVMDMSLMLNRTLVNKGLNHAPLPLLKCKSCHKYFSNYYLNMPVFQQVNLIIFFSPLRL